MKVLMLKCSELPETAEIGTSLAALQAAVGGRIELARRFSDGACLICNEDGKLDELPPNRMLLAPNGRPVDYIAGDAFICGSKGEEFTSLSDWQIAKYAAMFRLPIPEDAYAM